MKSDSIPVVEALMAAINRHSLPDMGECMAEDHVFIDSQGRAVSAREAILAGWKSYFAMFPDYTIGADTMLAEGDTVAIFGQAAGTFSGKRGPVPENRIVMPAAWKAVVRDGKIKLWQVYADWSEGLKIIERETRNG